MANSQKDFSYADSNLVSASKTIDFRIPMVAALISSLVKLSRGRNNSSDTLSISVGTGGSSPLCKIFLATEQKKITFGSIVSTLAGDIAIIDWDRSRFILSSDKSPTVRFFSDLSRPPRGV